MTKLLITPQLLVGIISAAFVLSACSPKENAVDDTAATATDERETVALNQDSDESPIQKKPTAQVDDDSDMIINPASTTPPIITPQSQIVTGDAEVVSKDINPVAAAVKQPSILTNPTTSGTPEHTVKLALDTLYYGEAEKAAAYYHVDMENFTEELKNTQFAFQKTVDSVTLTDTKYNADKTKATVTGELRLADQGAPAPLSYDLQKINGQWKILG
ncbi:hypothetical protein [Psychrobacter ciconiae]|uniref:hypothetical protein n=1 Tax=Psychrobacter ciconiae TaxID=1553449 RepID=UPI00191B758D|nr:hypothetical protein [Psychrobacter ciconiae]